MTKNDLIKLVTNAYPNLNKKDATSILNLAFENIINTVATGEEVRINDFGTFKAKKFAQKKVINPQTKDTMIIPERFLPVFRPFKIFKNEVKKLN